MAQLRPSSECPQASIAARRCAARPPVQSEYPVERRAVAAVPLPESPQGQTSKSISVSFVRIESNFLQYTGDTKAKMMYQNFEIRIL